MGRRLARDRGDGDDPEEHRQVPVAERAHGGLRPLELRQCAERVLGSLVVAAEVEPPQACAQREADDSDRDERAVDRKLRGAEADSHDGLADGDDHDQAVALDEVRRRRS